MSTRVSLSRVFNNPVSLIVKGLFICRTPPDFPLILNSPPFSPFWVPLLPNCTSFQVVIHSRIMPKGHKEIRLHLSMCIWEEWMSFLSLDTCEENRNEISLLLYKTSGRVHP